MIAKNICHAAVFAGSAVLFRSAPLLEELYRQTPEGRRHKLRIYANSPGCKSRILCKSGEVVAYATSRSTGTGGRFGGLF